MSHHLSPTSLIVSALWLLALDLAAWNLGTWMTRRLPRDTAQSPLERHALSLVVGLTGVGTATLLLALVHGLHRGVVLAAVGLGAAHAVVRIARDLRRPRTEPRAPWPRPAPLTAFGIAAFLVFLPLCFLPDIPHDSAVYHLALPELYLRAHHLPIAPYNLNANMPHNVDVLFAPALAGGGVVTATLLMYQWGALALVGLSCVTARLGMASLTGPILLLVLASPVVQWHVPLSYIEPALGCLLVFALLLLLRWREEAAPPLLVGCAWLVGWLLGSKYTMWYMSAGLLASIVLIAIARRGRFRAERRSYGLALLALIAPVAPWLARQWIAVGDPLYPHLSRLLHERWWSPVLQMQTTRKFTYHSDRGWLVGFLRKPFDLVENPSFFLTDAFSGLLVALFLAAFLLPAAYRGGRKHVLLAAGVAYLSWALVPVPSNEGRYLVAAVPLMALAGALVLEQLHRNELLGKLALVAVGVAFLYTFSLPKVDWKAVSRDGVDQVFQARNGALGIGQALNQRLPADARVLFMFENRTLGLERDRWVETLYEAPLSLELIRGSATADQAASRLRALGFTHLAMNWGNANGYYFNNPGLTTHWRIYPEERLAEERRLVEALLRQRATQLFEVYGVTVYKL